MPFKNKRTCDLREIINELKQKRFQKGRAICGSPIKWRTNLKELYVCTWKACKTRGSICRNTIFYKPKLQKRKILRVLELWMMKASTDLIEFSTGVSRKRIWTTLRNVAHILVPRYYDNVESIGASGAIVEIDESKFGKRKYNRGHHVDGVWILGAVEKTEPKRIILVVVDDRKKKP